MNKQELLATLVPFDDRLAPEVADLLIALARSTDSSDVNDLIKIGMTRGLRHPRFAVEAVQMEVGLRLAEESVGLSHATVKVARWAVWVAVIAAGASVANVIAVLIG
jgi:hypothetical protein